MPNNDSGLAVHRAEDNFGSDLVMRSAVNYLVTVIVVLLLLLLLLSQPLRCDSLVATPGYVAIIDILIPTPQGALHLDLIVKFRAERVGGASDSLFIYFSKHQ